MSQALCQKDKLKGPINGTTQPNGQMPQAADSVSAVLEEAQAHAETWKDKKPALGNHQEPGAPPAPQGPKSSLPHPLRCRGPGTPVAAPPHPPRPRAQAAGSSPPRPTTSCRHSHQCRPGVPRAPAAVPGLHGDPPGLRAPSPRCRQEASYAPPPQQARSINVHKQQMNKS
ncbi:amyloid beta A4 precursor protein-binding family B member 1-interacting protein-like isoform X2 [Pan troglodytes]|uniref:amyloid beta A4 precursor protein-binding family B member 1-interacting protein-like isoform X2 n=1 Tax=Pan troglodytes TaxID=9598 RepID=UPI0023F5250C|nr:amyloid beta A4 precursor protein-binding family B member 1-interacting protein-like isoform X2 [Pan troglodytes]XP_054516824.1 amyloid beta A4 precursor protein-binding family B member 1-interacting protein-like isoform X2 [Pan troglodytes]